MVKGKELRLEFRPLIPLQGRRLKPRPTKDRPLGSGVRRCTVLEGPVSTASPVPPAVFLCPTWRRDQHLLVTSYFPIPTAKTLPFRPLARQKTASFPFVQSQANGRKRGRLSIFVRLQPGKSAANPRDAAKNNSVNSRPDLGRKTKCHWFRTKPSLRIADRRLLPGLDEDANEGVGSAIGFDVPMPRTIRTRHRTT
jgi:hypothetical protein